MHRYLQGQFVCKAYKLFWFDFRYSRMRYLGEYEGLEICGQRGWIKWQKKFVVFLFLCITVGVFPLIGRSHPEEHVNIPRMTEAPKIDGNLDNPLWKNQALKVEDFFQYAPKEKGVPTQKTVVYMGYDRKNLYVAFQCSDSEPEKIRASITNRDNIIDDDWVAVFIDTFK